MCKCVHVCYLAGSLAIVKLFGQEFNPLQHCRLREKRMKNVLTKAKNNNY